MKVHLALCGLSILTKMEQRREPWHRQHASLAQKTQGHVERLKRSCLIPSGIVEAWREGLDPKYLDLLPLLPADISAERKSLELAGFDPCTDKVVFAVSDTPAGVLAGHLNAVALGLDPVYVDEPPPAAVGGSAAGCTVLRIRSLNPTGNLVMWDALGDLARALVWATRIEGVDELAVNLTGGFKATIPFVIGIVEALPPTPVHSAYCLFEGSLAVISLPLRAIGGDLGGDLQALSEGRQPSQRYEGWAYEVSDGAWKLTKLGEVLDLIRRT